MVTLMPLEMSNGGSASGAWLRSGQDEAITLCILSLLCLSLLLQLPLLLFYFPHALLKLSPFSFLCVIHCMNQDRSEAERRKTKKAKL